MEDMDRQILRLLARDGRMSFTDLAKATGLSVSAVHTRVKRLEQRGVVRGYCATIDPSAPDDTPERLAHLDVIEACHSVAGEESYILKVRVGTPGDLESLLYDIRAAANVSTRTTVVLSTSFEGRPPSF